MNYAKRMIVVFIVGIAAILVDSFWMSMPAPPGWLLAWAGWLSLGLALLFGGKLLADIGAPLVSRIRSEE